jgi:hypothetical protein
MAAAKSASLRWDLVVRHISDEMEVAEREDVAMEQMSATTRASLSDIELRYIHDRLVYL